MNNFIICLCMNIIKHGKTSSLRIFYSFCFVELKEYIKCFMLENNYIPRNLMCESCEGIYT